jgi:hypothetical protein
MLIYPQKKQLAITDTDTVREYVYDKGLCDGYVAQGSRAQGREKRGRAQGLARLCQRFVFSPVSLQE